MTSVDSALIARHAGHLELGRSIDRADIGSAIRMIEQLKIADPKDLLPYYGRIVLHFGRREIHEFFNEFSSFVDFLNRTWPEGLPPETARIGVFIIEQACRMAETFFGDLARQYPQEIYAFLSTQVASAREIALALGERALAESLEKMSARYWHCADANSPSIVRTMWRPDTPRVLQVEPTNQCNLKCVMCPRTTVMTRAVGDMDPDLWAHIIETWSGRKLLEEYDNLLTGERFFSDRRGAVKLFNFGEFLMLPNFEKFIEIARQRSCFVGFQTNGVLLARRSIRRRLLEVRPEAIGISIDGFSAETYEAVRAGSRWETLKRGVDAFIAERDAAGLSDEISVTLTTILPDDCPESRRKVHDFLRTLGGGRLEVGFLTLSSAQSARFLDADGHVGDVAFKPTYSVTVDRPTCAEPIAKMQILASGEIVACCYDVNGEIEIGHASQGVDTVWQGAEMRRLQMGHLRHELADFPTCQQCLGVNADGTKSVTVGAN
jgi:wyosine [tRNA(Phe)-imidazoG37] synthetase (radical SAM superfamily)